MRNRVPAFRTRALGQAAFIVVIAGVSAACSNSSRLLEPFFTGSTENQKEIIGKDMAQPMPAAIPPGSTDVTRTELPPPPQTAYAQPMPAQPAPQQVASNGRGSWSALGGQVVTLKAGENLELLSQKYGVPPEQILAANQFRSAADVRPGRVVVIPHRVATTPETAAAAAAYRPVPAGAPMALTPAATPAVAAAPAAVAPKAATTHVVAPGETLYAVSRKYGVKVMDIATLNGFKPDTALATGQVLRIPAGGMSKVAVAPATPVPAPVKPVQVASTDPKMKIPAGSVSTHTAPGSVPPVASTFNAPAVPSVPQVPVVAKPQDAASAAAAVDQAADTPSTDGTSFRWPVRGRIIAGFGSKPNGEKNDGINLAVPEGTTVKAAEAGVVIYAGNELEGYGNLILIRHADGWVSAYAHNKDILVKRGDKVVRGQTVSHAGSSGSVSSPQVHFELRKGAKPVNPLDYLAG